jgi:AmpD protein
VSGTRPGAGGAPLRAGADGWLDGVRRIASPNTDARPDPDDVSLVILHNISLPPGCYGAGEIERLFTNTLRPGVHPFLDRLLDARVSAHFLVARDGGLTQFVACRDRAWHAGVSSFRGRARCNDYSIGIELEGTDFEPYETAQYATLEALLAALSAAYPLRAVTSHSAVSAGRKTDPGPSFDWARLALPAGLQRA